MYMVDGKVQIYLHTFSKKEQVMIMIQTYVAYYLSHVNVFFWSISRSCTN